MPCLVCCEIHICFSHNMLPERLCILCYTGAFNKYTAYIYVCVCVSLNCVFWRGLFISSRIRFILYLPNHHVKHWTVLGSGRQLWAYTGAVVSLRLQFCCVSPFYWALALQLYRDEHTFLGWNVSLSDVYTGHFCFAEDTWDWRCNVSLSGETLW